MKTSLRVFLFFLFFTLEVRVKAQQLATYPNDLNAIELPENCLEKQSAICAVKSHTGTKKSIKKNGLHLVLGSNSVVEINQKQIKLIKGHFLVMENSGYSLSTRKLKSLSTHGELLYEISEENSTVYAINDHVYLQTKGDLEKLMLLPATSLVIGKVGPKGYITDFPLLTTYRKLIQKYSQLYPSTKQDFLAQMHVYRNNWKVSGEKLGKLYKDNADLLIAQQKAADLKRKQSKEWLLKTNQGLVDLFRQKNYIK
ncbi:MAG: hypothetical protein HOO06_10420 [Bdellovibrionaceae bacterium]|jgi:hypothetical protein|nr:hypothetical protein [Pseudobdellovibrionaceae bacterium]